MTDPMDALVSLQAALDAGTVKMRPAELYPELQVLLDRPQGEVRLTYARLEAGVVQYIAILVSAEPVNRVPCFALGCAVTKSMRGRGFATEIARQAIAELQNGLKRNGVRQFYVEAVVAKSNEPSNRLAKSLLSDSPSRGTDAISGEPVFCYLKLFESV